MVLGWFRGFGVVFKGGFGVLGWFLRVVLGFWGGFRVVSGFWGGF